MDAPTRQTNAFDDINSVMGLCHATINPLLGVWQKIPQALTLFGIACYLRNGSELNSRADVRADVCFRSIEGLLNCHMLSEHRGLFGLTRFQSSRVFVLDHESYP